MKKPKKVNMGKAKYHPSIAQDILGLALLGWSQAEIAKEIGVNPQTLCEWSKNYIEVNAALRRGRDLADGRVMASLYERATGYTGPKKTTITADGDEVIETHHLAPDVKAQEVWLKARRAEFGDKLQVDVSKSFDDIMAYFREE